MASRLNLRLWTDGLLRSYARIFFSDNRLFGLLLIGATMVVPAHGSFGVLAALISNFVAYGMGLDRTGIKKGLYGFNGVLTGLGIGFFFKLCIHALALLVITSILVLLVRVLLDKTLQYYLGLPSMSLPFTLVTWLIILASSEFGYLNTSYDRWFVFHKTVPFLPVWLDAFLTTLGAVLFQLNSFSGMIIAIGMIYYSRISFILMLIGFGTGMLMHQFLGVDPAFITSQHLGFNYMLTSLAIGGIFMVPSARSVALAIIGTAISALFLTGLQGILPGLLTPLAMPFNLTVLLILFVLKNRSYPSLGVVLDGSTCVPEESLTREQWLKRSYANVEIGLPFNGKWKVTQGIDGRHTHKDDWRFAYDFMAFDSHDSTYKNKGLVASDYYAFGLPVLAPSPGTVVASIDFIDDNPIGMINAEDNWGNYVIIEHMPGFYSCIAHLKKDSLTIKNGQKVEKGQVVGLCGNSGHSPYPHIHLQLQMHPFAGAPSLAFDFAHIRAQKQGKAHTLLRGTLEEEMFAENMDYVADAGRFLPYNVAQEYIYDFNGNEEAWRLGTDLTGNLFLESRPTGTKLFFTFSRCVLRINRLEGSTRSGLYFFGKTVAEIPFLDSRETLQWTSYQSIDYHIHHLLKKTLDLFCLIGLRLSLGVRYSLNTDFKSIHFKLNYFPSLSVAGREIPLPTPTFLAGVSPLSGTIMKGRGITLLQNKTSVLTLQKIRKMSRNEIHQDTITLKKKENTQ